MGIVEPGQLVGTITRAGLAMLDWMARWDSTCAWLGCVILVTACAEVLQ